MEIINKTMSKESQELNNRMNLYRVGAIQQPSDSGWTLYEFLRFF